MVHYHHGDQHDGDLVDLDQHDGHHEEEERGVPLPIPRKLAAAAQLLFCRKNLFCLLRKSFSIPILNKQDFVCVGRRIRFERR